MVFMWLSCKSEVLVLVWFGVEGVVVFTHWCKVCVCSLTVCVVQQVETFEVAQIALL